MTLQEQKNCPMISSKATVASRNSLHWSCKPLIRLRKILASRSLEKGRSPSTALSRARRVGINARRRKIPTRSAFAARRRTDLPFSRLRDARIFLSRINGLHDQWSEFRDATVALLEIIEQFFCSCRVIESQLVQSRKKTRR